MRGNTATISVAAFAADWSSHIPIASICERWTISKDQVIRLVSVWKLPRRHDRAQRYKPTRQADPTPKQIRAACVRIQATWTDAVREERRVTKTQHVTLRRIELDGETRDAIGPDQWYDDGE